MCKDESALRVWLGVLDKILVDEVGNYQLCGFRVDDF